MTVLVHHPEWNVSANSVSLHQLGKVARELQRGFLGRRRQSAGVSSHVGYKHLPESLCGNTGALQLDHYISSSGNYSIGSNSGCIGA